MDKSNLEQLFNEQKDYFKTGATFSFDERKKHLLKLKRVLIENEKELTEAVFKDFQKPANEAFITEIGATLHEIDHSVKHLKK